MKKYNIIYADPPWRFRAGGHKKADNHYNTMPLKEIMALNIGELCDRNCVLFLWTTSPLLPEALQVVSAWGFIYKTVAFTWVKTISDETMLESGLGYYTRSNTEYCLLATKGRLERKAKNVPQVVFAPRTRHSEKPAIVRHRITTLFGELPRIELFSRHVVEGWDRHGSDVGDIRDFIGTKALVEIEFECFRCKNQYSFWMQEGDEFCCPICKWWFDSNGEPLEVCSWEIRGDRLC